MTFTNAKNLCLVVIAILAVLTQFSNAETMRDRRLRILRSSRCPRGKLPAYMTIRDTVSVSDYGNVVYLGLTQAECIAMCTDNVDFKGNKLFCSAVMWERTLGNCTVSRHSAEPRGPAQFAFKSGSVYFEKFCLSKDAPSGCGENLFYRQSQGLLMGFAHDVKYAESIEMCLDECFMSGNCSAVMYFYKDQECILSAKSAIESPGLFVTEKSGDMVEYIENGCLEVNKVNIIRHPKPLTKHSSRQRPPMMDKDKDMRDNKEMSGSMEKKEMMDKMNDGEMGDMEEKEGMMMKKEKMGDMGEMGDGMTDGETGDDMEKKEGDIRRRPVWANRRPSINEGEKMSHMTDWSDWSDCDPNEYTKSRTRQCKDGFVCDGPLVQTEECLELSGWSAWSEPCQKFTFNVTDPCLGFKVRVCLSDQHQCLGPQFKYCLMC